MTEGRGLAGADCLLLSLEVVLIVVVVVVVVVVSGWGRRRSGAISPGGANWRRRGISRRLMGNGGHRR